MNKKKRPQDYPQMAFRISKEDKKRINALAEEIVQKSNRRLSPQDKVFRKNDVLIDALYKGLLDLKRKGMQLIRA
ncbi:MAG: hypothetical protein AB7O96_02490 [Pseudobdellovibrionaceae bacterium]